MMPPSLTDLRCCMRISDDRRREVAARLRETCDEIEHEGNGLTVWELADVLNIRDDDAGMMESLNLDDVRNLADLIEPRPIDGNTSDGYHTFNELYHHRAVLFSVIVKIFADRAWKSKLHADGTMYDGMFIVGIETPDGQATYHYDIDPYWNMFQCKEVGRAPEWDGHTPDQAIERIGKLIDCKIDRPTCNDVGDDWEFHCSACGCELDIREMEVGEPTMWKDGAAQVPKYCPSCGAEVVTTSD